MSGGYMGKILDVDVTHRKTTVHEFTEEDQILYLGNKILGAKILLEMMPAGVDPLGPENLLVITTGPLTGSGAPTSARFSASAKSPLTGAIGHSNCGGDFGTHLKKCGFDALVIRGAAASPTAIHIRDDSVEFEGASELWGKDTDATTEAAGKKCGSLVIGPAGENLVRFAAILSGDRAFGRTGLGAVMGAKKIKLVTARGTHKVPIHNPEGFRAHVKSWTKHLQNHPVTGDILPKYGTANLVRRTQRTHTLTTRNYRAGQFDGYEKISGETMAETRLVKNKGCKACPIQCGRVVQLNGEVFKGPEFETLGVFGSNLLNDDLDRIIEWNRQLDLLGMDTISMGVVIGFAMELSEQGLLESDLEFGRTDNVAQYIEDTAYRRGLGDDMANGVRAMAEKYGGNEFAMHSKGLEYAAYEPRGAVGQGLGYATANRGGCHLDSGYPIFFEALGLLTIDPLTTVGKAALCVLQQNLFESVSASGSCLFTAYAVVPGVAGKLEGFWPTKKAFAEVMKQSRLVMNHQNSLVPWLKLHVPLIPHTKAIELLTGHRIPAGTWLQIGERGYNMERMFNVREGLRAKDDTVAERLRFVRQRADEPKSRVQLDKMLPEYYRVRGWSTDGVPTPKKLKNLNISWCAQAM